jgi:predicted acyltransferase
MLTREIGGCAGLPPDTCRLVGLFTARHDSAGVSFLVGVVLPYSIASRPAKGGTFPKMFLHALWRAAVLIALGIFLRSMHSPQTYFTFEDTLTQIGLGYPFLFLLGFRPPSWQWIALFAVLFGYWLLGQCIRCLGLGSTMPQWGCRRIGAITTQDSWRIGIRTAISEIISITGF